MAGLGNGVGLASCLHESRLLWLQETETEQVRNWLMPKADSLLALGGLEVRRSGWEPGLAFVETPSFPLLRPCPPPVSLALAALPLSLAAFSLLLKKTAGCQQFSHLNLLRPRDPQLGASNLLVPTKKANK